MFEPIFLVIPNTLRLCVRHDKNVLFSYNKVQIEFNLTLLNRFKAFPPKLQLGLSSRYC